MKRNERDWAGQLISWIKKAIDQKETAFQDVSNDTGIKVDNGRTKFPDILLFTDKISGIIFNGWELKFPDTKVDEPEMLKNALEKAKKIQSDSFVTWNGSEAIIWKINEKSYSLETLSKIKHYPKEKTINAREDLANPIKYLQNEELLKKRAKEILHDLGQLYINGQLKPAINISFNIINAINETSRILTPQFTQEIIRQKGSNANFRNEFNQWKIYEEATLKILASSSRRSENVIPEEILAQFTFYNLIGKILFYLTLSENLNGTLSPMSIEYNQNVKEQLSYYFDKAKEIDYQAIFKPYFTDNLSYSDTVNRTLAELVKIFTEFDFGVLPAEVIGTILENIVPKEEKQKLGQYFTQETLANLVAFPVVQTNNDYLLDPTSGTGTFLNSFYNILVYHGKTDHSSLLDLIWGNDISHFPAILSVINLYKQNVLHVNNFPRVIRDDFFNINVGDRIKFPDSLDYKTSKECSIPLFDGVASNFPFIQQEDIPNEKLTVLFKDKFQEQQRAFMKNKTFKINERSDYFTYCVYNSFRFIKEQGYIGAITSNAWLGKEYGFQFKKFLLDNFHIKYIVKSNAEHWFEDSKVSTLYMILQKRKNNNEPTKFITVNFKLEKYFDQNSTHKQLNQIEDLYAQIDNCQNPRNAYWTKDKTFNDLYISNNNFLRVCIVEKPELLKSINEKDNWNKYFISSKLFENINKKLIQYYPTIIDVFRGVRTGWNEMFIIPTNKIKDSGIESNYLQPYVKGPAEFKNIKFNNKYNHYLFVCGDSRDELPKGTQQWILKFQNEQNKNGAKTIQQACSSHKPYWYSLRPKQAHIVTAINPYERFFFTYNEAPFTIDQRLIALHIKEGYDIELICALLNSAITFLSLEMRGTSRNLGALDLNANYLKQLKILNPHLLSEEQINKIKKAFEPLKTRNILEIQEEVKRQDRIHFDRTILSCFGVDERILENIYTLLISSVNDRVAMQNR